MNFEIKKSVKTVKSSVNKIINGDCLEILSQIPDNTFDMVFADPPYNLQLQNELYRPNLTKVDAVDDHWDKFENFSSYDKFTHQWISEVKRVMKPSATFWVIGSYHNIFRVGALLQDMGFWILNDVIWVKSNPMPNFRGVRLTNATETLIWCVKDQKVKDYTFNYKEIKKFNNGKQLRNDWYFSICNGKERLRDEEGNKIHSTQKPLDLMERIILTSTKENDLVLDPFGGSGTTAVAAYLNNRNFISIEKEKKYAQWSVKRLNSLKKENIE